MRKSDPDKLRNEARRLISQANETADASQKRELGSRAFALAQDAEMVERNAGNPHRDMRRK